MKNELYVFLTLSLENLRHKQYVLLVYVITVEVQRSCHDLLQSSSAVLWTGTMAVSKRKTKKQQQKHKV